MFEVALFEVGHLLVGAGFDMHEMIVGSRQRADQLIELQLGGGLLAALGVLNGEHHDRRHRRGRGGERRLPGFGEARDR